MTEHSARTGVTTGPDHPTGDGAGGAPSLAATSERQPPGLYLLFVVEMWERFSYYGMRALLVLYLIALTSRQVHVAATTGAIGAGASAAAGGVGVVSTYAAVDTLAENPGRGWSEGQANLLYGWYTGLAYLMPLIGGFLADRFLGPHRSVVLGSIVMALGHLTLGVSGMGALAHSDVGMSLFIGGLALIIIGTGYFKPCMPVMIGQMYTPHDPRREGAFTIFYMGVNLGAFICPFVCGTLGEKVGWHWGFGAAAVGMTAGLTIYLAGRPRYLAGIGLPPPGRPNIFPLLFLASILVAAGVAAVYHLGAFGWLAAQLTALKASPSAGLAVPLVVVATALAAVVWFVAIQRPGDKGPTACIFIFMLFNAFFWLAYEQAGSTFNVFAKESTDRNLFGWEVPATWFQSVNALEILLLGPVFTAVWYRLGRRGLDPSQSVKIGLGLLLLGAGYLFVVTGAMRAVGGHRVSMVWLLATYTLHTMGELCLAPTGLAFVTRTAPVRFVALLTGMWFVSNFLANLGGGIIASYVKEIERGELDLFWYRWFRLGGRADYFLMFVISSIGAGLVILILTPLLKRLLRGRE